MTTNAAVVKRAFRPDLIKVPVLRIPRIAFTPMTGAALPQLRNTSRVRRVMAPYASCSGFGFVGRIGVRIDSRLV